MKKIYESESFIVVKSVSAKSTTLVISFQQRLPQKIFLQETQSGFAQKFLEENDISAYYILIKKNHWYQVESAQDCLNSIVKDLDYSENKKIFLYGQSMGGYACLLFYRYFPTANVVAISPLYGLNKSTSHFEKRWGEDIEHFSYEQEAIHLDKDRNIIILYDNKSLDNEHIKLLDFSSAIFISIPYAGHPVSVFLNEVGLLSKVMLKIFKESNFQEAFELIRKSYRLRGRSHAYHVNLFKSTTSSYSKQRVYKLGRKKFPKSRVFTD